MNQISINIINIHRKSFSSASYLIVGVKDIPNIARSQKNKFFSLLYIFGFQKQDYVRIFLCLKIKRVRRKKRINQSIVFNFFYSTTIIYFLSIKYLSIHSIIVLYISSTSVSHLLKSDMLILFQYS